MAILFQLFHYWQERALRKAALLFTIGCLCGGLFRWARARRVMNRPPPLVTGIILGAALLTLGNSLAGAVGSFRASQKLGDVFHDQGQIAHRALQLLAQGVNPYGTRTMLDPLAFSDQVRALSRLPDCGVVDQNAAERAFQEYWGRAPDPNRMRSLPPAITDSPACRGIRQKFQSLGYHYGPVLLLSYLPLVALLGPAGIYAVHAMALLIWLALLGAWLKKNLVSVAWLPALSAITVFLLAPIHVRYIFLYLTASDLIPVILASVGLLL